MFGFAGRLGIVAAAMLLFSTFAARAENVTFPAGPVKIVTQQGPGGATIPAMRLVADRLAERWGQPATFIAQPGAGGILAAKTIADAAPDGRTLFMALASAFVVLPETHKSLPFDVNRFTPVGFVGEVPMAIGVSPSSGLNSLRN